MEGRFPRPVTPGYADDGPLSSPIRRYVDWPAVSANFEARASKRSRRQVQVQSAPRDACGSITASTSVPPLGGAVGRRRKYETGNVLFYGYPPELIARWCALLEQTALLYKNGTRKPSRQALKLFVLHRDGRVLGPEWREWSVHKNRLVSPEGQETTQGQLNAYWLVMQLARELTEKDPEARQEFYRILAAG